MPGIQVQLAILILTGLDVTHDTTGGGSGSFLNYASFMKRSQGAVKLGVITPVSNNVVSLMCGILIFSTVFSVQLQRGVSKQEILETIRYNGPANTGLTFIW